ncbi:MAG TPA: hypothetical protein VK428_07525 [Acidimicrobiales bacterium]|nr:hypothetical protein [Acidimicrobiales bacterium]
MGTEPLVGALRGGRAHDSDGGLTIELPLVGYRSWVDQVVFAL